MSKYIKSLPCSGLKLVKSGSDIISVLFVYFSGYTMSEVSKYIKSLPCSGLKLVKSGSDIISVLFVYFSGYTLSEVSKYIKSLPCSGLKLVKSGSDIISEGVVNALENEAKRTVVSILYSKTCPNLDKNMRSLSPTALGLTVYRAVCPLVVHTRYSVVPSLNTWILHDF